MTQYTEADMSGWFDSATGPQPVIEGEYEIQVKLRGYAGQPRVRIRAWWDNVKKEWLYASGHVKAGLPMANQSPLWRGLAVLPE